MYKLGDFCTLPHPSDEVSG